MVDYIPVHNIVHCQDFLSKGRNSVMNYHFCFGYIDWERNNNFQLAYWITLMDNESNKQIFNMTPHLLVSDGVIEKFKEFTDYCKSKYTSLFKCKDCEGSGKAFANDPPSNFSCETCKGTGKVDG